MAVESSHAATAADAPLIDPWNGLADLRARRLRHVTPAFAEDPVRILRVARFRARWPDFTVATETLALMREMVAHGEADHLVAERVWQEVSRGLLEISPGRMVDTLADCGLLDRLGLSWLLRGALRGGDLESTPLFAGAGLAQRWCWLVSGEHRPDPIRALCEAWRVPGDVRELSLLVCRERGALRQAGSADADAVLALFDRCDAWRRPARVLQALDVIDGESLGEAGGDAARASTHALREALARVQELDSAAITRAALAAGATGPAVGQRLHEARRARLLGHRA